MRKIAPHLWFDKEAKEAATFYTSIFPDSKITISNTLHDTPSGDADIVSAELAGQPFAMISAGPLFKFNPSISFLVSCETKDEVDRLSRALGEGGKALMEVGAYPFSERYGWIEDRYGVTWQLMYSGGRSTPQKIKPVLMFTGKQAGRAEEAMRHYTSIFPSSKIGEIFRYSKDEDAKSEGMVKFGDFALFGEQLAAMDSAQPHGFTFNEAISLIVHCDTQREIDDYWSKLSADPKAEQCGWMKDKYGVSWQIVPTIMGEMLSTGDPKKIARVTQAFLKMKKFDIAKLEQAFEG
jgi:predicted 3-demethylubiquinone-9 3-methyltransferase (glyoxalase superfamily)